MHIHARFLGQAPLLQTVTRDTFWEVILNPEEGLDLWTFLAYS